MEQTKQAAIILKLMDELRSRRSWCGETHIQKCVYLGQEAFRLATKFEYVLYKYGPYSFDLRDLLGEMRADLLIDREARVPYPYGPTLKPSPSGAKLLKQYESDMVPYEKAIRLVADEFGQRGVSELEQIGTALFVTRWGQKGAEERANRLTELKPHVSLKAALAAVNEVDDLLESTKEKAPQTHGRSG